MTLIKNQPSTVQITILQPPDSEEPPSKPPRDLQTTASTADQPQTVIPVITTEPVRSSPSETTHIEPVADLPVHDDVPGESDKSIKRQASFSATQKVLTLLLLAHYYMLLLFILVLVGNYCHVSKCCYFIVRSHVTGLFFNGFIELGLLREIDLYDYVVLQVSAHSGGTDDLVDHTHADTEKEEEGVIQTHHADADEESDFSSVGDDVPDNIEDDSWSSDSSAPESDMEVAAAGVYPNILAHCAGWG